MSNLKIKGIGRTVDNETAILVMASRKPTDDELRAFHEWSRTIGDIEALGLAIDRLESCIVGLTEMKDLPDRIHVEGLRGSLPDIEKALRAALKWKSP